MTTYADAELSYWGDQFAASDLTQTMTFERFMALPHNQRRNLITASTGICLQNAFERDLPALAMRGDQTIEPLHHSRRGINDVSRLRRLARSLK